MGNTLCTRTATINATAPGTAVDRLARVLYTGVAGSANTSLGIARIDVAGSTNRGVSKACSVGFSAKTVEPDNMGCISRSMDMNIAGNALTTKTAKAMCIMAPRFAVPTKGGLVFAIAYTRNRTGVRGPVASRLIYTTNNVEGTGLILGSRGCITGPAVAPLSNGCIVITGSKDSCCTVSGMAGKSELSIGGLSRFDRATSCIASGAVV